ncbi:hypothetical protein J4437_00305 [Candidatus Woesearchaeota archaeon]|nr:hypothetical protein [Candidatus Woesearchaeota archaeon]
MSFFGYGIEIYGLRTITQDDFIQAMSALPTPGNIRHFFRGIYGKDYSLINPSKDEVLDLFLNKRLYQLVDSVNLSFNFGEPLTQQVNLSLHPNFGGRHMDYNLDRIFNQNNMQHFRNIASISSSGAKTGEIDRTYFDYIRILAENLIPKNLRLYYNITLPEGDKSHSILEVNEYIDLLEVLVLENCKT